MTITIFLTNFSWNLLRHLPGHLDWDLGAVLLGDGVTLLSGNLHWPLEGDLLAGVVGNLLTMLVWNLDRHLVTVRPGDVLTVGDWNLDWNLVTLLMRNLEMMIILQEEDLCKASISMNLAIMTLQLWLLH